MSDSRPALIGIPTESSDDQLVQSSFSTMAKKHACAFLLGWMAGTSGINPFGLLL